MYMYGQVATCPPSDTIKTPRPPLPTKTWKMNRILCLTAALSLYSLLSANTPAVPADMMPQKYTGIDINTTASTPVSYGGAFEVSFEGIRKNGKKKLIRPGSRKFSIDIEGGWLSGNKVFVTSKPEKLGLYAVKVKITQKGGKLADSLLMPLDFSRKLSIDFAGQHGISGEDKHDRFTTPLIGRDGRDGRPGENGADGTDGSNISVSVFSVYNKDLQSDIYIFEVKDLSSQKTYYYNWIVNPEGVEINTYGGNGGNGGNGGAGGNGKDGEYIADKNKFKDAGSGGNGGNGGAGGAGGNGGNTDLYIGESFIGLLRFITVQCSGGFGGQGGWASQTGGLAGRALPCQQQPADGKPGSPGNDGKPGQNGSYRLHRE